MAILSIDIGGTYIKYGVWHNEQLKDTGKTKTPDTWQAMKMSLIDIKTSFADKYPLKGVAFSVPGAPNSKTRQIEGESLVEYLHYFSIYDELEAAFNLPVTFENDANCATYAELWLGAAQQNKDVIVVVLGTGIGGSIVLNREIVKGFNSYAGEIGFMLLNQQEENFGELATAVQMAKKYAAKKGLSADEVTGEQVFKLASEGDALAKEVVDAFFYNLALGLYNLNAIIDPEKIILGGGVSKLTNFKERVETDLTALYSRIYAFPYKPRIEIAHFHNDANLIGAIYPFQNKMI